MFRLISALLVIASISWTQESRGTIAGMVMDAQSAGIPATHVVITNVDTGVSMMLETNQRGAFSAPLLLPGSYRVTAEHEGFKKFTREGITLSVNDNLHIDVMLQLGAVSEIIDVTASAPLVESSSGSMGMVLGSKEITELPLAQGNPFLLIGMAPGVSFEGDPLLNRPYEPGAIASYSMSGSVAGSTDITMDGVMNSYKGSVLVGVAYTPPTEAIGEMRIETSSFDARAGQTSGGLVNVSLRSGTNKMRGTLSLTTMRPQWMANTWFGNRNSAPRGDFDYNRWGASLSGPVVIPKLYNGRNRTFFMWAYEAISDQRPRGGTSLTVPTAAERKGDFSELLALGPNYQIYDPFTRRRETGSTTRFRQDPFPGNVIPASLFNPVALKMMDYFPAPINNGTTADHRNNYPKPNQPEEAAYYTHIARLDQNFSSSNRMFLRGNGYVRDTHRIDYFETRATGVRENYYPIGAAIDDVHTISPRSVIDVRYGFTRVAFVTTPLHGRNFDLGSLGFPASYTSQISPDRSEFPVVEINGFFNTINTSTIGSTSFQDSHSLVVAFTTLRGSHTIDIGFEARGYHKNANPGNTERSGRFIFDTTYTRGPLDNSTAGPLGQGWASFLLGIPNASSYISRDADYAETSTVWAGYVQDNWRVRRNLTVNLGLRYELEGPLTERYNRSVSGFDPSVVLPIDAAARAAYAASYASNPTAELPPSQFQVHGGLLFPGVNGQSREMWKRDINNLAPRVALAYTLGKSTVIRSGYGIFFGTLGLRRSDVLQNGFSRDNAFIPTKDGGLTFYSSLSNPFPDGIQEGAGSSAGPMTDVGNTIRFLNSPTASYNQRWQISIQRQFGGSNMLELAYVGNRSTKTEITRDLNVVGNQMLSRTPFYDAQRVNYLTANIPNPFRGLPGVAGTLGSSTTITRETLLKPHPQFTAVNTSAAQGYSWYHSVYLRGMRRLSKNLTANGSFTWSKSMAAISFLNPADPVPYRSLSGTDRPFRVTGSAVYQLPFGRQGVVFRKAPRWLDAAVGGWQLSAIYIYQSGAPLSWGDVIFFGNPDDIANGPHSVERWFNTDVGFTRNSSTRPSYHYRTWPLYLSTLRRASANNVDFSIGKRWNIHERGSQIQIRGEALNAFNHPQFGGPNLDQFSSSFGQITATSNYPRQIQAVFRLLF